MSQQTSLRNDQHDQSLHEHVESEVPPVVPSKNSAAIFDNVPDNLAEVIAAWNSLPESARAGVLAVVRAMQGH